MTYSHYPATPPEGFLVVHKDDHNSYQYLDSIEGIARFLRWYGKHVPHVRPGMDLDVNASKRNIWMAHWNATLQHYFKGKAGLSRSRFRLTRAAYSVVRTLRSTHKDSRGVRIPTFGQAIAWISKHDRSLVMLLEAKTKLSARQCAVIRKAAEKRGVTVIIMRIDDWPTRSSCQQTLKNAHRAGLYTLILARGDVHPSYFTKDSVTGLPWLDYGKGSRSAFKYAPEGFKRVGLGYGDATVWGAGCHHSSIARTKNAVAKAHAHNVRF